MSRFVDRVVLHVSAGNGGHGCASVHREKFKPLGGPDGGNGGNGGDVILVVDANVHTLLDFHFRPHAKAGNGKPGQGGNRDGANGEDLELRVPDGTVVLDEDGEVLADLVGAGTRFDRRPRRPRRAGQRRAGVARRARPPASRCSARRARARCGPRTQVGRRRRTGRLPARRASRRWCRCCRRPSRRSPTTRSPRWCPISAWSPAATRCFTIADVPGLIPGASQGKGLGLDFLRHIERCAVLVHVVDCATSSRAATRCPTSTRSRPNWPRTRPRCPATRARRSGRPPAPGDAEQDRRPGGRASSPRWSRRTSRRAAGRCSRSRRSPTRGCAS